MVDFAAESENLDKFKNYTDKITIEHSYIEVIDAVDNKVFGFNSFNVIRNNIEALKDRFFMEHSAAGAHLPTRMGWKGASAFGRYVQGTGLADSLNISSVTNSPTGNYFFALSGGLVKTNNTVLASLFIASNSYKYRVVEYPSATTTSIQLLVYDTSDNLVDLQAGTCIQCVMFES